MLADEISPDTCRFWDSTTHEKLDKDRFRRDLGGVEDAYQEIMTPSDGGMKMDVMRQASTRSAACSAYTPSSGRGRRLAVDLSRPLRASAPRPGELRHRREQTTA